MLLECRAGAHAPTPTWGCNRRIKFGACLNQARRLGAERLATGHHARLKHGASGTRLLRARDPQQGPKLIFCMRLTEARSAAAFFPVGELDKEEVRGHRAPPRTAELRAPGQHRHLLCRRTVVSGLHFTAPGPCSRARSSHLPGSRWENTAGLAAYTIGQRRGLGPGRNEGLRPRALARGAQGPERQRAGRGGRGTTTRCCTAAWSWCESPGGCAERRMNSRTACA